LLLRQKSDVDHADLARLLAEWERWSAEVLESHLSYPVLAYFRSQHGNQSWLAALTTMLDTSALVMIGFDGWCMRQAQLTFAMARHAVVDLAQVFSAPQPMELAERLDGNQFAKMIEQLGNAGMTFRDRKTGNQLTALRRMYEPYVLALSRHLAIPLPVWIRDEQRPDNWQSAPWKLRPSEDRADDGNEPDHF
jgi:hypothetical protein